MTLKELKKMIEGQRIDRIAGFCDSYEQMFDRCRVDVHNGSIVIDTGFDGDNDDLFEPVPKVIDQLHAIPNECDDYPVLKSGLDNENCNGHLFRHVSNTKLIPSDGGNVGLCLLGRESIKFVDDEDFLDMGDMYHVEIVIEDPRAKKLNGKFGEFLYANCNWFTPEDSPFEENCDIYIGKDVTFIDFIADEASSAALTALIAGAFEGAYFTRTLLSKDVEVERISNDREGKYYKPYQAEIFPAYIPDEEIMNPNSGLTDIAGSACYVKECDSKEEMEQFIASHNHDKAVGDMVRRIITSYIDDPLKLILK